jgi:hypothetical protein
MSEADAAKLLEYAQADARVVRPEAVGPIGKLAFSDKYDAYACRAGTFKYGVHLPQAKVPFLVEAWARVDNRDGRECTFSLMVNRTAITTDVRGSRSWKGSEITVSGAHLYSKIDTKRGSCEIFGHITSPLIPVSSIGKNPNLSVFEPEICEAVRLAFNQSRRLISPDATEPKPPPKPKPEIFVPTTVLGKLINAAANEDLVEIDDLTVLSKNLDPYRFDAAKGHAEGRWFAAQVERFVVPHRQVHLRGLHYAILSSGRVYKPDGTKYINDDTCWNWLQRSASKAARWLGYVPFEKIRDERNEPPEVYCPELARASKDARSLAVRPGDGEAWLPPLDTMLPTLTWSVGVAANQPYRIAFVGEKSSLGDVLRPIAREIAAEMLLFSGDASDTLIAEMAGRAAADGRPLVVLYFADFDPGGWAMPIAVARKFQALVHLKYPNLQVQLHRVALTYEQVIEYDLPSTPLKDTERRKGKWYARWGREQTEIDALATLRPDILEAIVREAIKPFYDPTLDDRVAEANRLPRDVVEWFEGLRTYTSAITAITAAHEDAEKAIAGLKEFHDTKVNLLADVVNETDDIPELPAVTIEPIIDATPLAPLFTATDSFVAASRKLIASKKGGGDDDDKAT